MKQTKTVFHLKLEYINIYWRVSITHASKTQIYNQTMDTSYRCIKCTRTHINLEEEGGKFGKTDFGLILFHFGWILSIRLKNGSHESNKRNNTTASAAVTITQLKYETNKVTSATIIYCLFIYFVSYLWAQWLSNTGHKRWAQGHSYYWCGNSVDLKKSISNGWRAFEAKHCSDATSQPAIKL